MEVPYDPITLDNNPTDGHSTKLEPRRVETHINKNYPGLWDELKPPGCCAGFWELFRCHRPGCLNDPKGGNE